VQIHLAINPWDCQSLGLSTLGIGAAGIGDKPAPFHGWCPGLANG
jgi:hypothetical protein